MLLLKWHIAHWRGRLYVGLPTIKDVVHIQQDNNVYDKTATD